MDTLAGGILIVFGIVAFSNYRKGDLGPWLRTKFLNQPPGGGEPEMTDADHPKGTSAPLADLALSASGRFVQPVAGGRITGEFGDHRGDHRHTGVDWAVPTGTPVSAAQRGRVIYAGPSGSYGNRVDVDHGAGWTTRYAHLDRIGVRVGQVVDAGHPIALSGNTGRSTGPHLHFELRRNGSAVDPMRVIVPATLGGGVWS